MNPATLNPVAKICLDAGVKAPRERLGYTDSAMRPLQRPRKSVAEIEALPALGSTQCSAYVREHGSGFAPETLVFVMREAKRLNDTLMFELAATLLIGREAPAGRWTGGHCEPTISSLSRAYGFWSGYNLRIAFRRECLHALWEAIHAGRELKPYWEERFGHAFKARCIDMARSLERARNRNMEADEALDAEHAVDVDDLADGASEEVEDGIIAEMSRSQDELVVMNAIRALTPRQGMAVTLAWMEGRQIEGEDGDTVSAIMGISPTAVYKLLRKALIPLRANPALRAIWSEEA